MARKEFKGLMTRGDKGRFKFRYHKDIHCMGRMGTGDCNDCMRINQMHALTCKNMGDYLPKNEWNKIIGNGALQQFDRKSQARSSFEEELVDGRPVRYDKFGLPIGPNGC
jgi:hypothetical protein